MKLAATTLMGVRDDSKLRDVKRAIARAVSNGSVKPIEVEGILKTVKASGATCVVGSTKDLGQVKKVLDDAGLTGKVALTISILPGQDEIRQPEKEEVEKYGTAVVDQKDVATAIAGTPQDDRGGIVLASAYRPKGSSVDTNSSKPGFVAKPVERQRAKKMKWLLIPLLPLIPLCASLIERQPSVQPKIANAPTELTGQMCETPFVAPPLECTMPDACFDLSEPKKVEKPKVVKKKLKKPKPKPAPVIAKEDCPCKCNDVK